MLPRFCTKNKSDRMELWIDNNTSVKEVEDIGRLALASKIKTKYGLWFPEKPLYWLSIVCYLLDGGDIHMRDMSQEERS